MRRSYRSIVLSALLIVLFTMPCLGAAPVVITMMQFNRAEEADWQRAVVQLFNEEHKDIQIELLAVPDPRPYEKAIALWAAGMPPHISYGDPHHTISWGIGGLLLDLEPYYLRDVNASDLADFFPGVLDMHAINGQRFGIPIDLQVQAFFYAKIPFDEAGLAYPDTSWTWDTVAQMARRLVIDGPQDGVRQRWAMRDPQWLHWWSVLWHYGGEFVDDPKQPTRFIGDSPSTQEGLRWVHHMIQELKVMPTVGGVRGGTAQNLLVDQNIAMAIGSSLYQQQANQYAVAVPWDVTHLPSGPAGNTAFANALGWVVYKDAGDHEQAWQVLKYFSSEAAMRLAVEMRGTLVPHVPTTRDVWLRYYDVPQNRHVFIEAINMARPLPVLYDQGLESVQRNVTAYWNGLLPLSQAIENMRIEVTRWIGDVQ